MLGQVVAKKLSELRKLVDVDEQDGRAWVLHYFKFGSVNLCL
jgi:hypothetical protein